MPNPSVIAALLFVIATPVAHAQDTTAAMRERAVANCKANRGVDCASAEGLREWIDAERPRPPGQRSAIQEQKLEAARKAERRKAAEAARHPKAKQ